MKTSRIFGVEIELGASLTQTKNKVHPDRGLSYSDRNTFERTGVHPYGQFEVLPGWRYVYDGSCGAEIVSPPLNDTWSVTEICNRIKSSGISYVLKNTGLHVHVQAIDYTPEDVLSISKFCRHFNRTIYSFMAKHRFKDEYCRPNFVGNKSLEEDAKGMGWNQSNNKRYRGLNTHSLRKHGTIEFRYSEGTDDPARIEALVDFYTSIMEWCKHKHGKVKSPKGIAKKREYLLSILGVYSSTRNELLKTEF